MHTASNNGKRQREQFPVDVRIIRGIRFTTDSGDLLRITVMNDKATARHSAYREYHYGNSKLPLELVEVVVMNSGEVDMADEAIDTFARGMSDRLDIPQVVSFSLGIQAPIGAKNRLFKAIDPDDHTKMLGLLIEQDEHGKLQRVTWYKAWEASAAFRTTPKKLVFQLVKDESGAPTLDPNQIGGWTWYFSTTIGVGLSASSTKE